jgi:hypothetical protein
VRAHTNHQHTVECKWDGAKSMTKNKKKGGGRGEGVERARAAWAESRHHTPAVAAPSSVPTLALSTGREEGRDMVGVDMPEGTLLAPSSRAIASLRSRV